METMRAVSYTHLGILDEGIISLEELKTLICQARQSEAELIMTGTVRCV